MTQWLWMTCAVLAIFTVIGIGALARRLNWLTEEADQSLLKVVVNILMPALILKVTLGNEQLLLARNVILPPLVGFVTVIIGFALALAVAKFAGRSAGIASSAEARTFALCIGIYNYSYIPLPLATQLFGAGTVAVLFVHNLGVEFAMWTLGVLLVSGHVGRDWYKRILNLPTLAILAALVFNFIYAWTDHLVPESIRRIWNDWIGGALTMMGLSAIPMALLLIGATTSDVVGDAQLHGAGRVIGAGAILRLGVLPVLFLAIAWMIPGSIELKCVIALQAAMPCAVFPIVLARHYGGHAPTAVRVVLGTAILSLITMPMWLSAGIRLLGLSTR